MNYFFGFNNRLANNIDWFFNANHLFLIAFVSLIVVSCLFMFNAKSEVGKRITKIFFACLLIVLEVGRTVYKYKMHVANGGTADNFNWWWNISFQMCAIMTWTTIFTLILSACVNKENHFLQFLYNILFGCAMIGGILTFCYPDCLDEGYPFFHFINIQTVLVHALLIFVPLYFIKIKEFKVEIKNIWKACAGYTYIGCTAMSASILSGNNFAYSLKFDLFELGVAFPWHLPVILCVMMALASLFYGGFEIVRLIRRKIKHEEKPTREKIKSSSLGKAIYVVSNICAILFGTLIMLGVAKILGNPIETGKTTKLGLLCLLGLAYMILVLVFADKNKKYIYENLTQDKVKHVILIVLTILFVLPVGILYLIRFVRENKRGINVVS
ncbi:MAG: hypothetical protein ACI4L6_01465 [Candidatus Onthoplasma sp.]